MENTQIIAERIKIQAKAKNIPVKQILEHYSLGKNLINKLSNGSDIYSLNLLKIADYLGCSTDYLFGRVDSPTGSYVNGNNSVQLVNSNNVGDNSSVTITDTAGKDNLTEEFIKLFDTLAFLDKVKVINFVTDMTQK